MVQASVGRDKNGQDIDRNAILMMLAYVEAECRRMGSEAAAHHAAIAAALVGSSGGEMISGPHGDAEDHGCSPMH